MLQYASFKGITTIEAQLGETVLAYLDEKLAPGQIAGSEVWDVGSINASTYRYPRYYIQKTNTQRVVWFCIRNVAIKYWLEVVRPGLEELAKRRDWNFKYDWQEPSAQEVRFSFMQRK